MSEPKVRVSDGQWAVDIGLLAKLGSLAVHVEEAIGPRGHPFDIEACRGLVADPEVQALLSRLAKMSLLPVRR